MLRIILAAQDNTLQPFGRKLANRLHPFSHSECWCHVALSPVKRCPKTFHISFSARIIKPREIKQNKIGYLSLPNFLSTIYGILVSQSKTKKQKEAVSIDMYLYFRPKIKFLLQLANPTSPIVEIVLALDAIDVAERRDSSDVRDELVASP